MRVRVGKSGEDATVYPDTHELLGPMTADEDRFRGTGLCRSHSSDHFQVSGVASQHCVQEREKVGI